MNVEAESSSAPILSVSDQSGREIRQIVIQIPGASLIKVLSNRFARSEDGYVAVGGMAFGDNHGAGFLIIIDPDGARQTIVRTYPYVPYAVAFASDGNIWTAGVETDEGGTDKGLVDYSMLRRFDRKGRLLGGTLSRLVFSTESTPIDRSKLVSTPSRIGWFNPLANRYIEFGMDGTRLSDYSIDLPGHGLHLSGSAFCKESLWVSIRERDQWVLKSLDRNTGHFIDRFSQKKPFLYLYGCSGDNLVVTSTWSHLEWLFIPR